MNTVCGTICDRSIEISAKTLRVAELLDTTIFNEKMELHQVISNTSRVTYFSDILIYAPSSDNPLY